MPWCPSCKMEYVEGIKICPDCKKVLVRSLVDDSDTQSLENELYNLTDASIDEYGEVNPAKELHYDDGEPIDAQYAMNDIINTLKAKGVSEEEIQGIIEGAKRRAENALPPYKCIKDKYNENKSASGVLIVCGLAGLIVLILNLVGALKLPIAGPSKWLTTIVMGILFLIFVLSGVKATIMVKKLKPMVEKEDELIKKSVEYLKEQYAKDAFSENILGVDTSEISFEEQSLFLSNRAINALETNFEDLPEGFSYYVVDRFYSEIFEENNED